MRRVALVLSLAFVAAPVFAVDSPTATKFLRAYVDALCIEQAGDHQKAVDTMAQFTMLKGAMAAEGKVGLMMNVPKETLKQVLAVLPALQNPTISSLSDDRWVAVNTILEENVVRHMIPQLKAAGASGIVEYSINKIIA